MTTTYIDRLADDLCEYCEEREVHDGTGMCDECREEQETEGGA